MAEFITTNQAAKKLCVSVETVYNMLQRWTAWRKIQQRKWQIKGKLACKC